MQSKWKIPAISILTALTLVAAAGCSDKKSSETASPSPAASVAGTSAVKVDPLAKYDPPIEVSVVRYVDQNTKFRDGESIENNAWNRGYEQELGVKLKTSWSVTGTPQQMEQKLNVAIASGELPDMFLVNGSQLKQLVESNQVEDLTQVFADNISPLAKSFFDADGGNALKSATFNGKLMGIPQPGAYPDGAQIMYIRTDWLKKLNLPEPKTMQDVMAIADAFTAKDPDGNTKNDTFGFPISNVFDFFPGIANAYHAYFSSPYNNIWVKDQAGNLVYGNIQPEMKTVLAKMQEMYKKGEIDPEFGVKDTGKVREDIASGKFGIIFGPVSSPIAPLQAGKDKDPNMDWQAYPLPSIDSKAATPQLQSNVGSYVVVKKGAKHPEALIKIINFSNEKVFGKTADISTYYQGNDNIFIYKYAFATISDPNVNVNGFLHITEALKNNDPSKLTSEEKLKYDSIVAFRGGDNKQWNMERVFGPTGSFSVTDYYLKNNLMMKTEFFGAPTPTMVEKKASLDKMTLETFTKIIMGSSPVDEFDNYVTNWKKLGGDAITKEVNDWKASQ